MTQHQYAGVLEEPIRGDVYANLHEECLSVIDRRTDSEEYGNVVAHIQACVIDDVDVVTYEGKRREAIEDDRKNVHAMFRGTVQRYYPNAVTIDDRPVSVSYHMDRSGCFYTEDGARVTGADRVEITRNFGIYAIGVQTA